MAMEFGMWIWPVTIADQGATSLLRMRDLGVDVASVNIGIYTSYRLLLPENEKRPIYNMEEGADVSPRDVSGIAQAAVEAGADGIWFFSYDLADAEVLEAVGRFIVSAR